MREVYRSFDALAGDFAAFNDRLKRAEGRAAQDKKRGGPPLELTPEFLQLLASGAAGKKPVALVSPAPAPRTFPPHDGNATPCLCRECSEVYETDAAAVRKFSRG
jgi:hypothetical protein